MIHPQVAITSRDERILSGVFYLLSNCLSIAAVAPALVQHYGRQILAEVLPRLKGVYPKKMMRDVAVTLQRMMMQDREGLPQIAMDILRQVSCYAGVVESPVPAASSCIRSS